MKMINLPSGLFFSVQEFLVRSDYITFVNSSKLLNQVKLETIYFDLNWESSLNYAKDENFRSKVIKRVKSPQLQIALSYDQSIEENVELAVHSISFYWVQNLCDLSPFRKLPRLYTNHSVLVNDVSMLGNISDLTLTYCTTLTDVSALRNVRNLNLHGCNRITDVSTLGNIHKLTLSSCNSITDISCLGKRNHYVDLRFELEQNEHGDAVLHPSFSQISKVSSLENVHTVILAGCKDVVDVSMLGNVYHLDLSFCENLEDISKLHNNKILLLRNCKKIRDFHSLGKQFKLNLSGCMITDEVIPQLSQIGELNFNRCPLITDLSALTFTRTLNTSVCKELNRLPTHLPNLRNFDCFDCEEIQDLYLAGYPSLTSFTCGFFNSPMVLVNPAKKVLNIYELKSLTRLVHASFSSVKFISEEEPENAFHFTSDCFSTTWLDQLLLFKCGDIQFFHGFTQLRSVEIGYCSDLKEISDLHHIDCLSISYCDSLVSLHSLHFLKRLNVSSCKNLETMYNCHEIDDCTIHYCDKLVHFVDLQNSFTTSIELVGMSFTNVDPLMNVPRLKLSFCKKLETVRNLTNVKELYLLGCPKVTDSNLLPSTVMLRK
jgi:hypothetical protein